MADEHEGEHESGHWIKGAIKHPGALHRELGVPQGKKIPRSKILKAAKSGGTLGRRARLAETLSKMHHGSKH
jgi:hypothetical protein